MINNPALIAASINTAWGNTGSEEPAQSPSHRGFPGIAASAKGSLSPAGLCNLTFVLSQGIFPKKTFILKVE